LSSPSKHNKGKFYQALEKNLPLLSTFYAKTFQHRDESVNTTIAISGPQSNLSETRCHKTVERQVKAPGPNLGYGKCARS